MSRKYNKTLIFLNGNLEDLDFVKKIIDKRTFIVGCDGGLDRIYELGLTPDAAVGDFDSAREIPVKIKNLPPAQFGKKIVIKGVAYVKYPTDKDYLDSELALDFAIAQENDGPIILVNTLGSETDHVLGTVFLLAKPKYRKRNIKILQTNLEIYAAGGEFIINGKIGQKISLIPISGQVVVQKSEGLKYDPAEYRMSPQKNIGISNELTQSQAKIIVKSGCFLVVHHHIK